MDEKKQKPPRKKVLFSLHAPQAETVFLAGDFNQWNPEKNRLKKGRSGAWEVTLMLSPRSYEYKFIVDGKWQLDPVNSQTCHNCFGSSNNLVTVSQ
jgi:1,4-alpha-glucan branching enzyme